MQVQWHAMVWYALYQLWRYGMPRAVVGWGMVRYAGQCRGLSIALLCQAVQCYAIPCNAICNPSVACYAEPGYGFAVLVAVV